MIRLSVLTHIANWCDRHTDRQTDGQKKIAAPYVTLCTGWRIKRWNTDLGIEQFWKQLAWLIARKCGDAEPLKTVFDKTTIHCNDVMSHLQSGTVFLKLLFLI